MATFSAMAGGSPFQQAGNMNPSDPWGSYNSAYGAAAATNQNLYSTAMGGYAQMIAQANAAQQQNQQGWGNLQRNVMNRLKGSNRANLQDIADQFTKLSGSFSQQMIDRGLGNTTVQQSMQRGVAADYAKERTRSQGAFAQLQANYLSQIGSNRLQAQQQGIGMMSGLQSDQMHYLSSIQAPYPDPGMYAAMASQQGGGGMMPGMPGPAPSLGPTGGQPWHPPTSFSYSDGGGNVGGGGGFGGWSGGYGGPSWNVAFGDVGGGGGYSDLYAGGNFGGMGDVA